MHARDILLAEGIDCTVVNSRFVKPLDADRICGLVAEIPYVITVEENVRQGGFGSAVMEMLADRSISPVQVRRIGIPDRFIEHGAASLLRVKYGLDAQGIAAAVRDLIHLKAFDAGARPSKARLIVK